jgi:hypothetical protein
MCLSYMGNQLAVNIISGYLETSWDRIGSQVMADSIS